MAKQNYTVFWILGIFILLILILPKLQIQKEAEPLSIVVEYYKDGQKVSGFFSAFIVYDQVRFNIYASNVGGTPLSNIQLVGASPKIFKDNLPLKSYETLAVGEKNKLIFSTALINIDYFLLMTQPVNFWAEVSADGATENSETTFQLTFQQPFSDLVPHTKISAPAGTSHLRNPDYGYITDLYISSGSGYLTGFDYYSEYQSGVEVRVTIDGEQTIYPARTGVQISGFDVDYGDMVSMREIRRFENSLRVEMKVDGCFDSPLAPKCFFDYSISYMTDPGVCAPDDSCAAITCVGSTCTDACGNIYDGALQPDCGTRVCGPAPNGCGDENVCGTCETGYVCEYGVCVKGMIGGVYTGFHFDTSSHGGSSRGLTTDGTYIWISDRSTEEVYKYGMDGTYISNFSTSLKTSTGDGICVYGDYLYISDRGYVFKYSKAGVWQQTFDVSAQIASPVGISTDGTNFWICEAADKEVYKYSMDFVYTTNHFDISSQGEGNGLTTDGTYIWIIFGATNSFAKYEKDGTFKESWSTSAECVDGYPMGIGNDGTYLWVHCPSGSEVYKYG
jgi:hypothetical protein